LAGRLPAYLAALALGVSPVFWSQAIIAEVYTLNTFFFLSLVFMGLQACPPSLQGATSAYHSRLLPWMALLFGLSLSNHYPLMLLVAPAFVILLWPMRRELLQRFGVLSWLVILGLVPYVWMVRRSWMALPISLTVPWKPSRRSFFFLSRAGYAGVDQSVVGELARPRAVLRFFLPRAAAAVRRDRHARGRGRIRRAVAHAGAARGGVYDRRFPGALGAPAAAPWPRLRLVSRARVSRLSAAGLCDRRALDGAGFCVGGTALRAPAIVRAAAAAVLLAVVFASGARINLLAVDDWGARYAQTVLKILPANAVVITTGDPDLAPIAYFHMIENQRPTSRSTIRRA